jgi:hypothetical protein
MTISRRTAILAELAALDERILVADGADHEQLRTRRLSLERELDGVFVGVASKRSQHEWEPFFRKRERQRDLRRD